MKILSICVLTIASVVAQVPFVGRVIGSAGAQGQILYATTSGGYFKSIDAGVKWTPLYIAPAGTTQPAHSSFAVDPNRDSDLYLAAGGSVWKSIDAGANWTPAGEGLPEGITWIAPSANKTGTLYARAAASLYISRDAGGHWEKQGTLASIGGHIHVNGGDSAIQYFTAGSGVYSSKDEGATWTPTGSLQTFQSTTTSASGIVSIPNAPNRVMISVGGGLIRVGNQWVTGVHHSSDGAVNITPPGNSSIPIRLSLDAGGGSVYTQQSSGGFCRFNVSSSLEICPRVSLPGGEVTPTSFSLAMADSKAPGIVYGTAVRAGASVMLRSRNYGESWAELGGEAIPTLGRPAETITRLLAPGSKADIPLPVASIDIPLAKLAFTVESGAEWLTLSAASGETPQDLTATADATGLEPGVYETFVRIHAPGMANETVEIPVQITVPTPVSTPAPEFTVTTYAGTGAATLTGDGGQALEAGLGPLTLLTSDEAGNLYLYASGSRRIRRIGTNGVIGVVAGTGADGSTGDGGQPTFAAIGDVRGLAAERSGTLYLTDGDTIRQISAGQIRTLNAGSLTLPDFLAIDPQNRLWFRDLSNIRRYTPPSGRADFALPAAVRSGMTAMAFDSKGNLYIARSGTADVWKVTPDAVATLIAGNGTIGEGVDGVPATSTPLNRPRSLAVDAIGNVFIGEATGHRIRMVTPAGIIYTISPPEETGFPSAMTLGEDGSLYVAAGAVIRKYTPVPAPLPSISAGPKNKATDAAKVAPGTLFTIDGVGLAAYEESAAASSGWPTELGLAKVTINDIPVELQFASPARLQGLIPWEIEPGDVTIAIAVNGQASEPQTFTVHAAAPGIFGSTVFDASGNPFTPVPGSEASMLITGYGHNEFFTIRLGDRECEAFHIEAVSGMPGTGRALFKVPEDLEPGEYAATISVAGEESNSPVITVGPVQ